MRLDTIRDISAIILIFGHITAICLVFFILHDYFASAADKIEIALILAPLTGLFALAALKSIFSHQYSNLNSPKVSIAFIFVCIGIPLIFISMVILTIYMYPFGVASDPQSLKLTLSSIEVGLGGLLGLISEKLFGVKINENESKNVKLNK